MNAIAPLETGSRVTRRSFVLPVAILLLGGRLRHAAEAASPGVA